LHLKIKRFLKQIKALKRQQSMTTQKQHGKTRLELTAAAMGSPAGPAGASVTHLAFADIEVLALSHTHESDRSYHM
jgi:hypothetical protein